MAHLNKRKLGWKKRKVRVRKKISGSAETPRLNVYRSNKHIYAQLVDDVNGTTIASISTLIKGIKEKAAKSEKTEAAKLVGSGIGKLAKEKGIKSVVFDRGGYLYHGRVKAVADAAREAGLKF